MPKPNRMRRAWQATARRRAAVRRAWMAVVAAAAAAAGHVLRAAPGLTGLVLVAYGAWLAWQPAGYMVAGLLLLADVVAERIPARRRRGGDEL